MKEPIKLILEVKKKSYHDKTENILRLKRVIDFILSNHKSYNQNMVKIFYKYQIISHTSKSLRTLRIVESLHSSLSKCYPIFCFIIRATIYLCLSPILQFYNFDYKSFIFAFVNIDSDPGS